MASRLLAGFALLLAVAAPAAANACSCIAPEGDFPTRLQRAKAEASDIYFARAVPVDPRAVHSDFPAPVVLDILEVFKGNLKPQSTLTVRQGNSAACTAAYTDGRDYLLYAYGDPAAISICSMSHEAKPDDPELHYLRTNTLPTLPGALYRETVTCTPCRIDTVAKQLTEAPRAELALDGGPATNLYEAGLAAFNSGRPFWVDSEAPLLEADSHGRDRMAVVGRTKSLRAFELTQTPFFEADGSCRQRAKRRWCESLEAFAYGEHPYYVLKCVNPGPWVDLCNEEKSRKAKWGALESVPSNGCKLWGPAAFTCTLPVTATPYPGGKASSPVGRCSPSYEAAGTREYACSIADK